MVAILYGDGHQEVTVPDWNALYTAAPAAVERRATTTTSTSSSKSTNKVKTIVTTIATTTTITGHSSTSSESGSETTGTSSSSSSSVASSSSASGTWVSAYEVLGSETVSAYKNSDGKIVSVAYVVSGGSVTVVPYTGTATSITAAETATDATTTAETNTAASATASSSTAASQSSDSGKSTSHVGMIVAVVAILVALIALGLILFFLFRYRRPESLQSFFDRLRGSRTNITKQSRTAGVVPDHHNTSFDKEISAGIAPGATLKPQKASRHVREKSRSLPPSPAASSILTFPSIHDGAQGHIQMHPAPLPLAARRSMRPQLVQIPQRSPDTPPPLPSAAFAEHVRTNSFPHVASAVATRPGTSSTVEPFRQSITSSALISPSRLLYSPSESDDDFLASRSQRDSRTDSRTDSQSYSNSRASSHAPMAASARNPSYSTIPRSIARKPLAIAKIDTQQRPQTSVDSPTISHSPLSPPPRATLRRLDGSRTRMALSGIDTPASPPPMQAPPPLPPGTGIGRRTSIQGLEFYGYGTPAMVRVPISRYQSPRPTP